MQYSNHIIPLPQATSVDGLVTHLARNLPRINLFYAISPPIPFSNNDLWTGHGQELHSTLPSKWASCQLGFVIWFGTKSLNVWILCWDVTKSVWCFSEVVPNWGRFNCQPLVVTAVLRALTRKMKRCIRSPNVSTSVNLSATNVDITWNANAPNGLRLFGQGAPRIIADS